ncbi:hypothetical protein ACSSVY_002870 [Roseovarius sp. MBR-51]
MSRLESSGLDFMAEGLDACTKPQTGPKIFRLPSAARRMTASTFRQRLGSIRFVFFGS